MAALLTPMSAAEFARDLAHTVVACHHGNRAEAFTSLVGALIIAAGELDDPEEMLAVAQAALVSARSRFADHRAAAVPGEALS